MADPFNKKSAKILVFSTEKISDPAIDMAGLLKLHYPPTVYTITVPCSSGIRLRMAALCSVCSESFVKQIRSFNEYLLKTRHADN